MTLRTINLLWGYLTAMDTMKWLVRDANSYAKYVASYLERA